VERTVPLRAGRRGQQIRSATIQGMLWVAAERFGGQVVDQVFTIILARMLLPRDFGLLASAAIFTTLLAIFQNLGLNAAIVRRQEVDEEYLSTAFWGNVAAGLLLFAVTLVAGRYAGSLLREPIVGTILAVLAVRFLITAGSGTQRALITRDMDYRKLTLRMTTAKAFGGVVALGMALGGLGVWSLVGQLLMGTAASTALLWRATGWRPKWRFSWAKFVDLWSFGAPILLTSLFRFLIRNTDNLLVARYLGAAALGFYGLAYTVFTAPLTELGLIVNRVMFSALSRVNDDAERLRRAFLLSTKYLTMLALPMMLGLALVAAPFVEAFYGARWLPVAPVLSIFAVAGFLHLLISLGPTGLQAAGRSDLQLVWAILSAVLYIPAFAIGLRWGIAGVAAGYLLATCILTPLQYGFVSRVMGVTVSAMWDSVRPSLIGCVVMVAVVLLLRLFVVPEGWPPLVILLVLVAAGVLTYGGVFWLRHRQSLLDLFQILRQDVPLPRRRLAPESGEL